MNAKNLNESAKFYDTDIGKVNAQIIGNSCAMLNMEMLTKYSRFDSTILLGIGDGSLLEQILSKFKEVTVVEGSDRLVNEAKQRFASYAGLQFVNEHFENFQPASGKKVSSILGNHVLEHLEKPVDVIDQSRKWLQSDGIAIFTVPSATSLHRRIGVELGILNQINDLSDQDQLVGHMRVYDANQLKVDVLNGGYSLVEEGGFNLKLVSQAQMADWPAELHDAIYRISRRCPEEMCSNLYVVCRPR